MGGQRSPGIALVLLVCSAGLLVSPAARADGLARSGGSLAGAAGVAAGNGPVREPFMSGKPRSVDTETRAGAGREASSTQGDPGRSRAEGMPSEMAGLPAGAPHGRQPSQKPTGSVGVASTDAPEAYRVGPGDVLRVFVWQEPDASGDFKVGPQGTIQHYLVGEVGVSGRTVGEISEIMQSALAQGYLRDPRVSIHVREYQAQKIFVYGEVVRPGVYALRGDTDLLKILLDAGGPGRSAGGQCTLLQIRKSAEGESVQSTTIDLNDLLVRGDLSQNKKVKSGDVVFVHRRDETEISSAAGNDGRSYYVLGEVKNPGAYRYKEGASAMTAILEAGGLSDFARSNKTKLVREKDGEQETRIVKMGDVLEKGDRTLDVKLLPGDVLVVPKSLF